MNAKDNSDTQKHPIQDDGIIELTDVVSSPQDDEEIIDLVEEVDSTEQEPEEIIELTDAVSSPESDEEIIDLVEEVPGAPAEETGFDDAEVAAQPPEEETALSTEADAEHEAPIIGEGAGYESEPVRIEEETAYDGEEPAEENIIEFSGAPSETSYEDTAETYGLDNALDDGKSEAPEDEGFADAIGLELDHDTAGQPPPRAPHAPVEVTPDQVEAAVERVLARLFSEKIEAMIGEAIEKAVSKEIEALKAALLEDQG